MRQCRTIWESKIKLPEPDQVTAAETLAMAQGQVTAEAGEQGFAVICLGFATLLVFHNVVPDLPVGLRHAGIDGLIGSQAALVVGLQDASEKVLITRVGA